MTALLRKEARALLPSWAGTLALTAAPVLLLGRRGAELSWLSYAFGCALLGGASFGHEFQHRTLPALLSQPIARAIIWREKMLVLAAALLTSTAVLVGMSAAYRIPSFFDARFVPFIPLCVFCGAPLFTLLTGSTLGGGIFSLAVAGWGLIAAKAAHLAFPALGEGAVAVTLVLLYCAVAVVLGSLRFRTCEAREPRSAALGLPDWLVPRAFPARGSPLVALLRKELRLQQGTLAFGVFLWVLFLLGGVLAESGGGDWGRIAMVGTGMALLVLPLVAGAIAVGDERSLGVADWQLSLPPPARLQWLAKMLVTLPTSLVFGLVAPLLVRRPLPNAEALVVLVVGHLLLTHLAIYAGSLSRGTLPAILLAIGFWSALGMAVLSGGEQLTKPPSPLSVAVAVAPVLVVLQYFAFSNYRGRGLRPSRIGLQGLAITGLLATSALFLVA